MTDSKIDPKKPDKLQKKRPAEPANTELKREPREKRDPEIEAPQRDDDESR